MNNEILSAEKSLKENRFKVETFKTVEKAKEALLEAISIEESIAFGGSMTLKEMNLYKDFKDRGNNIYSHWIDKDKSLTTAKEADVYITSTNALTLDGKLVNMDGVGNRVSSMFYGHERVYIVVGKNKICKDYDEAKARIENVAAPKNARRLDSKVPCKITGKCNDCNTRDRICNVEVIIHKNPSNSDINVFLIDEDLGY